MFLRARQFATTKIRILVIVFMSFAQHMILLTKLKGTREELFYNYNYNHLPLHNFTSIEAMTVRLRG